MVLKVADRGKLPPFIVMDVMKASAEREATGADVLHLEVGQPSTSAPKKVLKAAKLAITNDSLGYTVAFGLPELRERISQHYKLWYGVDISMDRVAVTNGSSAAFVLSFMASFNPGVRVAMVAAQADRCCTHTSRRCGSACCCSCRVGAPGSAHR